MRKSRTWYMCLTTIDCIVFSYQCLWGKQIWEGITWGWQPKQYKYSIRYLAKPRREKKEAVSSPLIWCRLIVEKCGQILPSLDRSPPHVSPLHLIFFSQSPSIHYFASMSFRPPLYQSLSQFSSFFFLPSNSSFPVSLHRVNQFASIYSSPSAFCCIIRPFSLANFFPFPLTFDITVDEYSIPHSMGPCSERKRSPFQKLETL